MNQLQSKCINIEGHKVKLNIYANSNTTLQELEQEARNAYKFGIKGATFLNFEDIKDREFIEVL